MSALPVTRSVAPSVAPSVVRPWSRPWSLSLPEPLVAAVLRLLVRPVLGEPVPVGVQRFWLALNAALTTPPTGVRRERHFLGGVESTAFVPAPVAGAPVVLYLHGGAFVTGSWRTHGGLAGTLARELGGVVHVLRYRLAPEHPYPAGRDDALRAYRALVVNQPHVVVAGDSAGGAMVADLLDDLTEDDVRPVAGVMLSPVTGFDVPAGPPDHLLRAAWLEQALAAYRRPPGALVPGANWPPVYLRYSADELLAPGCRAFAERLGPSATVVVDPGAFHVLALLPGLMRRARSSVTAIADFSRRSSS